MESVVPILPGHPNRIIHCHHFFHFCHGVQIYSAVVFSPVCRAMPDWKRKGSKTAGPRDSRGSIVAGILEIGNRWPCFWFLYASSARCPSSTSTNERPEHVDCQSGIFLTPFVILILPKPFPPDTRSFTCHRDFFTRTQHTYLVCINETCIAWRGNNRFVQPI